MNCDICGKHICKRDECKYFQENTCDDNSATLCRDYIPKSIPKDIRFSKSVIHISLCDKCADEYNGKPFLRRLKKIILIRKL